MSESKWTDRELEILKTCKVTQIEFGTSGKPFWPRQVGTQVTDRFDIVVVDEAGQLHNFLVEPDRTKFTKQQIEQREREVVAQ